MSIEAGRSLLHYRLTEKIGAGGMGVVWTFDLTPDGKGLLAIQPIEQGHRTIRVRSGWRPAG